MNTCTVNGRIYRIGHAVVTGVESEEYIFSKINLIFILNSTPILCCQILSSYYSYHHNSYFVSDTNNYQTFDIPSLFDNYPLAIYPNNSESAIVLKHYIPTNRPNSL